MACTQGLFSDSCRAVARDLIRKQAEGCIHSYKRTLEAWDEKVASNYPVMLALRRAGPPKPSDVVTICYTSGTTGNPKGVVLTHENLMSNTAALIHALHDDLAITSRDSMLSYLPLAHVFEAIMQCILTQLGAKIGFYQGDIRKLTDDLQTLKPTIFVTVPRLLNRMYDQVVQMTSSSRIKSFIFNLALKRKMVMVRRGIFTRNTIWDKLVFGKVQALLGGNVRLTVSGSAPLAAPVLNFSRCAFGSMVMEGYGQTEGTAGISLTLPTETEGGHVGAILPCCRAKLVDVPEMDYYAKDGKGEICIQGYNVMKGYYKEPEKTAEALEDGWLHTGDIGMWLPSGTLKIIDRRKHIFKLAQGEYLAPQKIEGIYVRSPVVAQAFVDGDSLQTFAVGVMVPDPAVLVKWAKDKVGVTGTIQELCQNKDVNQAILEDIVKQGKACSLKGFEQVRDIHLHPELFSVENGLLTPTFKSKRPALRRFFSKQIEDMYKTNS